MTPKKTLLALSVPVLAAAAFLVWQNLPEKRFARHMIKARLYAGENNLAAARQEYEIAFRTRGGFTPYVNLEVMRLVNRMALADNRVEEALENTRLFVGRHPDNPEGRQTLAELAVRAGDMETAFGALEFLLARNPASFPARLLLTQVRTRQSRLDLAEEQLRYLVVRYPDSLQSLMPLAENLLKQGRGPESRPFLAKAIAAQPGNSAAHLMLVDSYLLERKLDSAHLALDAWKGDDAGQALARQIRRTRLYSLENRWAEADEALADFKIRRPEFIPALSELAILWAKRGYYDSAVAWYRAIADIAPAARGETLKMTAYLQLKARNPARALEALKTLQISDRRPALLYLLVAAYASIGQDNKIAELLAKQPDSLGRDLEAFRAQLSPDPAFIGQWALAGYYGLNRQDYFAFLAVQDLYLRWPKNDLAITLFASQLTGLRRYGDAARALAALKRPTLNQRLGLIQLYAQSGQGDKAADLAETLAAEDPKLTGVNLIIADHWFKLDRPRAIEHYKKELALSPDNTVVLNNLAWEYGINQSSLDKAQPYLDRLQAQKRLDPRILDTIGWILARNGMAADGEKHIRNALDLMPDQPTFLYHLGDVLMRAGRKEEARKCLRSALSAAVEFEEKPEAEKLLAQLG